MCHYLENKGIRCWYAPRDVAPGADWAEAIVKAINAAKVFVVIYSVDSNNSKQVMREVTAAADTNCEIIPFKISTQEMNSNFAYYLNSVHWLDATKPPMKERLYQLYVRIQETLPEPANIPVEETGVKSSVNASAKKAKAKKVKAEKAEPETKKSKNTGKSGTKNPFEKIKAAIKKKKWGSATGIIITVLIVGLIWFAAENQSADSPESAQSNSSTNYEYVFGSDYKRADIKSVVFVDSLKDKPRSAWEVLEDADNTIMAWVNETDSGYTLYIGSDGKVSPKSCRSLFYNYTSLEKIDFNDSFDTSQADDMSFMFSDCESLKELDVSGFDTSKVTNMDAMFQGCKQLSRLAVSGFDTSHVTDMSYMFSNCESLKELDVSGFDTGLVMDMRCMFQSCALLEELDTGNFKTSFVSDMASMFRGCKMLSKLDVSGFDTSHVTDMSFMFMQCAFITELDVSSFNTGYVTDMSGMFRECNLLQRLDVSGFDTSAVIDMSSLFSGCYLLKEIDVSGFNTGRVTDMSFMFSQCKSLQELNVSSFDTSNVTNMRCMFQSCEALTELDISNFNMEKVTDKEKMFSNTRLSEQMP